MTYGYYSVCTPWSEARHPTEADGPLSTLSRGYHGSAASAREWANAHLGGQPYAIVYVSEDGEVSP